jgi:hypothetical protein
LARSIGRALVVIAAAARHTAEWVASPAGAATAELVISALVFYDLTILRLKEHLDSLIRPRPQENPSWPH